MLRNEMYEMAQLITKEKIQDKGRFGRRSHYREELDRIGCTKLA